MRDISRFTLALLTFASAIPAARSAILYVNPAAAGTRTGASWNNGLATVAAGLAAAASGDEVWVKAGTYKETLTMKSGVGLYGGFSGAETARGQRDPAASITVLDGEKKSSVLFVGRGEAGTVINGFTIRNGLGTLFLDQENRPSTAGGGICIFGEANTINGPNKVEVSGNIFTGNVVGGPLGRGAAVYVKGYAQPRITSNRFVDNGDAAQGEGALFIEGDTLDCSPFVANNVFTGNREHAIVTEIASPTIANNLIDNNIGHGILVRNLKKATTTIISGNTIVENRPRDETAAWDGYGVYLLYMGTTKLANNIIAWNGAGGIGHGLGMTIEARNNCVYGNNHSNFSTSAANTPNPLLGNGNKVVNPQPASMPYNDYHIRHDSPCRNAGDPASVVDSPDMDGEARVQGGTVDIGYDESSGTVFHPGYNVVRVKPAGSDANDGSTWSKAKKTVQAGVNQAGLGGEVWVAAGTYPESVTAPQSVMTYGGFLGTETDRSARSVAANTVTIDAGGVASAYAVKGGSTAVVVFDGFTVKNSGSGGSGFHYLGGATADLFIRNNIVRENANGITVYFNGPIITDNVIVSNSKDGIYLNGADYSATPPEIRNNFIHDNRGSGIYLYSGSAIITNNQVTRNGTGDYEAGISLEMGGGHSADIVNNTIAANTGYGLYVRSGDEVRLTNNIVAWNRYTGIWKWNNLPAVLRNNCVYGNVNHNYANFESDPTGFNGNVSVDPKFATVPYSNFHIRHDSPCRDAGDNAAVEAGAKDIDSQARLQGAKVDIGSDESNGAAYDPLLTFVRVKPTGNDASDGSSWEKAKKTIQAAIDMALGGEVWVAAGTYQHVGAQYTNFLALRPNIPVYGGFAGSETAREQRNWAANATVLHGGNTGDVVTITSGVTSPTVLDGFTVTGSADFASGIELEANESPQVFVRNNVIQGNKHGITGYGASPRVTNNLVRLNTGKGISLQAGPDPRILNNIILRNDEDGLYLTDCSGRIANNLIADNALDFYEAGVALSLNNAYQSPRFENNTIVRSGGYGVNSTGPGAPVFVNNIIAWNGQGFRADDQAPTLKNNCLYGNREYNTTGFAADPIGANGNISADPKFASAAWADYHIRPDSPCREGGDNSVVQAGDLDFEGQPRVLGSAVDMGVDESTGATFPGNANAVHVSPNGSDSNDGSSWQKAKKTLTAALSFGPGIEVWVAGGTYTNPSTDEYGKYVVLQAHQSVYAGFAGTETERDDRDTGTNATILDGNGYGSSVVSIEGKATAPTVLDGFIIRNPATYGAGVRIEEGDHFTLRDSLVRDCNTGVSVDKGAPRIVNNTIGANKQGIHSFASDPIIRNNLLVFNEAEAIDLSGAGSPEVVNNTIARNTPADYSGAVAIDSESHPVLTNNIVAFNTSGFYGHDASPTLRSNDVFGNNSLDYQYITDPTGTNGNISADPLFLDADNGDFHLKSGSPCINRGDDAAVQTADRDLDLQSRKAGPAVDIGVDEFGSVSTITLSDVRTALAASAGIHALTSEELVRLNLDNTTTSQGRVDLRDAVALLRAMLRSGG